MKKLITLSLTCMFLFTLGIALIFFLSGKNIIKRPFSYTGNATFSNNTLTITESGTYSLSGYLEDGLIHVNAKKADVILELNNLEIKNTTQACIYVQKANSVTIVLADGSTNVLTSGDDNNTPPPLPPDIFEDENDNDDSSDTDNLKDEEKAVIYCKDDLILEGTGSLIINGYIKNGIQCADNLTLNNGCYSINTIGSGLIGRDSLTINNGTVNVTAHKDAVKSTNEDEDKGWVIINGGDMTLASAKNGIHAESSLTINGGNINVVQSNEGLEGMFITINDGNIDIVSSDDGINAYGGSSNFGGPNGFDGQGKPDWANAPDRQDDSDKPDNQNTADKNLDNTDISNHSKSRPNKPSSPGMGGHNTIDNKVTLPIDKSEVVSTYEPRTDATGNPLSYLVINGGTIYVDAQGDGLDSNGDLIIYGGYIVVHGPSNNGNGALDSGSESGGKILIHGGTIIAIGASGMAETFEEGSSQAAIRSIDNDFKTGDIISITNEAGDELISLTAKTSGNCIVFSHPDLNTNQNITITVDES